MTLHVGAGTFQPVRAEVLSEHKMHTEWYTMPQETVDAVRATRAAGRDVVAVGTTSLRALESASQSGQLEAGSADTALFITPGYQFKTVTRLITNFHLPKSTLLMRCRPLQVLKRSAPPTRMRSPTNTASSAMATPCC